MVLWKLPPDNYPRTIASRIIVTQKIAPKENCSTENCTQDICPQVRLKVFVKADQNPFRFHRLLKRLIKELSDSPVDFGHEKNSLFGAFYFRNQLK